jgi:hypothetical protein
MEHERFMNKRVCTHRSHSWYVLNMSLCRNCVFMKKNKTCVFGQPVYMSSVITNLRLFDFFGELHPMGSKRTVEGCGHIHV